MTPTLHDVFGQDPAVDFLRRALRADRLPHALVFAGPAGVGKGTTAQALGKLFLCEKPKDERPCDRCDSCRVFDAGNHPDFHAVYRQLIRIAHEDREAELMNATSQNRLLKTLEEPYGRALIILLTDQPGALLPTIRSRCQTVRF